MKDNNKEKVFISRDENSELIWIWEKCEKGSFKPEKIKNCDMVVFQRPDSMAELNTHSCYTVEDFKQKFGFTIPEKTLISKKIDKKLLNNEDYKMFSFDPKRKK